MIVSKDHFKCDPLTVHCINDTLIDAFRPFSTFFIRVALSAKNTPHVYATSRLIKPKSTLIVDTDCNSNTPHCPHSRTNCHFYSLKSNPTNHINYSKGAMNIAMLILLTILNCMVHVMYYLNLSYHFLSIRSFGENLD